jgi:antitoxin component YwqK of YwqJK toxin-antitoxin module
MGIFDFLKKNKNIENDNGLNEIYYDNGRGELKERFSKKNAKKYGVYEEWHDNGRIKFTTNYKDDIQEGKTWVYDNSGNTLREYMIIDGYIEDEIKYEKGVKMNGIYDEWKEPWTGEKFLEKLINYKDGKRHGVYEEFNQDGNKVFECNYKNNKKKRRRGAIL